MIFFLLRKTLLHCWDNLYTLFLANLGLALLVALGAFVASLPAGSYLGLASAYPFALLVGTTSALARAVSDLEPPDAGLLVRGITTVWKDALLLTACLLLQGVVLHRIVPFYLTLGGGLVGPLLGLVLLLTCAVWWMAMIYYFPVRLRLGLPSFKAARMAFLLFTANLPLSLFVALVSAVLLMLSLGTAMLLPGISFLLMLHQVAGKTILLKHRYLEERPRSSEEIPWSRLLKDDLEFVRSRSLKGVVFPWKE